MKAKNYNAIVARNKDIYQETVLKGKLIDQRTSNATIATKLATLQEIAQVLNALF